MKNPMMILALAVALANTVHAQDSRLIDMSAASLTIGGRGDPQRLLHDSMLHPRSHAEAPGDWWSIAASVQPVASLKLLAGYADRDRSRTMSGSDSTSAWVVGANYSVASGTFLLGYGRQAPERLLRTKQLSIGYEYPLSKRATLYADASQKKTAHTVRYYGIGLRTAY